jgi:hypothetical protein
MMTQNFVSVLLSPFWETVDDQWVGWTLLFLAGLMFLSSALSLARYKSWRMYFSSIAFLFLAGILIAPFADSRSPRELQHWLMHPKTLGTLAMLQIIWISVTVFLSVREEIFEPKNRFVFYLKDFVIRLISVFPSPVVLLFFLWIEHNRLISTTELKPQNIGIQVAAAGSILLTIFVLIFFQLRSKFQLVGLHLVIGCLLMILCSLLPCLTQPLSRTNETALSSNFSETIIVLCGMSGLILLGMIPVQKLFLDGNRTS